MLTTVSCEPQEAANTQSQTQLQQPNRRPPSQPMGRQTVTRRRSRTRWQSWCVDRYRKTLRLAPCTSHYSQRLRRRWTNLSLTGSHTIHSITEWLVLWHCQLIHNTQCHQTAVRHVTTEVLYCSQSSIGHRRVMVEEQVYGNEHLMHYLMNALCASTVNTAH